MPHKTCEHSSQMYLEHLARYEGSPQLYLSWQIFCKTSKWLAKSRKHRSEHLLRHGHSLRPWMPARMSYSRLPASGICQRGRTEDKGFRKISRHWESFMVVVKKRGIEKYGSQLDQATQFLSAAMTMNLMVLKYVHLAVHVLIHLCLRN